MLRRIAPLPPPLPPIHELRYEDGDEEEASTSVQFAYRPRISRIDALDYIALIRRLTANEPHLYIQFAGCMRSYQCNIVDIPNVIAFVERLFVNYPELLRQFAMFLPPGYTIRGGEVVLTRARR